MPENENKNGQAQVWSLSENPEARTVALSGEVDFTVTPKIRERLAAFIDATTGDVIVDLGDLEYIDSSGLAVMIEARKILAVKGRNITISSISPQVRRLFELTQIGDLFGL